MTIKDVFIWRSQGRKEEAYEAARQIYATDKGSYASAAMFWTAVDVLKIRVHEKRIDEARKIYKALERLQANSGYKHEGMADTLKNCLEIIEEGERREILMEKTPEHLQTGIWGEELAVAFLREKGYTILERDWHTQHRDIDIIAQQDDCIVFVEVKTRRNSDYAEPEESVNYRKLKNLRLAINHYIQYRKINTPWRFDVITVVGTMRSTTPKINHIEDFSLM